MTTADLLSPARWLLVVLARPATNAVLAALLFLVFEYSAHGGP